MVPVQTSQLKHVSGVECSESMQPPLKRWAAVSRWLCALLEHSAEISCWIIWPASHLHLLIQSPAWSQVHLDTNNLDPPRSTLIHPDASFTVATSKLEHVILGHTNHWSMIFAVPVRGNWQYILPKVDFCTSRRLTWIKTHLKIFKCKKKINCCNYTDQIKTYQMKFYDSWRLWRSDCRWRHN